MKVEDLLAVAGTAVVLALVGCRGGASQKSSDAGTDAAPVVPARFAATVANTRFMVADHMRASIEMQLSGEPFAQLLGYDLAGFYRGWVITDQYKDPTTGIFRTDPLGYATAVESYEYSKQPMNNLSFESGAGLSLQFGPVLNPTGATGDAAFMALLNRFQNFATESMSGGAPGNNYITVPAPSANPMNYYGWPGLWPVFAEFVSFDPHIQPVAAYSTACQLIHGNIGVYGAGGQVPFDVVGSYECDYNSLNLAPRDAHVTKALSPDALGYASWKQGLWVVNYWQSLHDSNGNQITNVAPPQLPLVGQANNQVVGQFPSPSDPTGMTLMSGVPGTFFGDVPIEGWQGLLMLEENDNKAALLLSALTSSDGASLGGLSVAQAIAYSYDSPLRYFPSQIAVTETATAPDAATATKYFPQPTAFAISSSSSRLRDLSGLVGGFSEVFILTDANNASVGGSPPCLATFDGDPFPADNQKPDGENTLHDRALGVVKVALVDLDRLHFDAAHGVLVDETTITGGTPTLGTTVTTVEAAEAILALRNAYRSLNASLQLYSNDTPDTLGAPSILDGAPLTGASYTGTLSSRIIALIKAQADFLMGSLTSATGSVSNSFDLSKGAADASPTTIDAEAAAVRGLLDAYLATSDSSYRTRATAVYADLLQRFWNTDLEIFQTTTDDASHFIYTPIRFGLLSGALRQYYKLVASQPGREAEATDLLAKFKRSNKLLLNGWDDVNDNDLVDYPAECTGGGLQLGERALTGEFCYGRVLSQYFPDRDHDCVPAISAAGLPAALGAELDLVAH